MTTTHPELAAGHPDALHRLMAWVAPVGPLAMAGWSLSIPYALSDSPEEFVPKMADELRVQLSFVMMLFFVLTIGVGVIVTGLVARRGVPRLGITGMCLAWLGFAAMGFGGIGYDAIAAASLRAGVDTPGTVSILEEADRFIAPTIGGMVFIPMSFLGSILLGVALWRGRTVPRWAAVVLVAAFPVILAGGALLQAVNAIGFLMIAVAFLAAGREYARTPAPDGTSFLLPAQPHR